MRALLNRLMPSARIYFATKWNLRILLALAVGGSPLFPYHALAQNSAPQEQATTPPSPQPKAITRAQIDLEKTRQALYAAGLPKEALVTLQTPLTAFVGLWEAAKGATPTGAILLLHGEGHTPDWPQTIQPLRTYLPERGWSTLSLSLPDQDIAVAPQRQPTKFALNIPQPGATALSTSSPTSDPSLTPSPTSAASIPGPSATPRPNHELDAQQRIAAGFQFLHEKGQFNIIIAGEGLGALRAAKYSFIALGGKVDNNLAYQALPANLNQRPIRAIVLINARNRFSIEEPSISEFMDFADVPVLDIYTRSHHLAEIEAKQRRNAARKYNLGNYYQVAINIADAEAFAQENQLTKRVRGFLNKHAKGVEIEK